MPSGAITPEERLPYDMSLPDSTTISGMESLEVLEQNLAIATRFQPMTAAEMDALRVLPFLAADGHPEKFKSTKFYDGDIGREQHGFPSAKELPL
jgi:hypothetical protein